MSAEHTHARLVLTSQDDYPTGCANFEERGGVDAIVLYHDNAKADARRLVACWNACEGLSTESLERLGTLDRARVSLDVKRNAQLEAEWVVLRELQRKCREAIAQRDELMAALRRLSFAAGARDNTMGDPCRLIEVKAELAAADRHAMAVIAKATRSAP